MTLNQKIHLLKIIRDKGKCDDCYCNHCIFYNSVDNQYCLTDEEEAADIILQNKLVLNKALKAVVNFPLFSEEDLFEELL